LPSPPPARALHPFPTRRSSDLLPGSADDVTINPVDSVTITHASGADTVHSLTTNNQANLNLSGGSLAVSNSVIYGGFANGGLLRSEEHTSELQSLAYLVCRLLL